MKSGVVHTAICALALSAGACRQADGQVPTPNATVQEELVDVTRDLQYIANGRDPQAQQALEEDLSKYARRPSAVPAIVELSRRTATVLPGTNLTEQAAQRLTHNLWVSAAAREISERQIETLQNDLQALLMSIGVPEPGAQQVAAQVAEVQRASTDRPRRWYELF